MQLKAADPQLIFTGDPLYRLAIDRSQRQSDDFNQVVGQTIEHLQESFQLMRAMRDVTQKLVLDLQKMSQLAQSTPQMPDVNYNGTSGSKKSQGNVAVDSTATSFFTLDEQGRRRRHLLGTSLTAAVQWLSEWSMGREKLMSDLNNFIMDPLVDFHNKMDHISKTNRKRMDKAVDEFEMAVSKFVAKRQRKAEIFQALYLAKKTACLETKAFVDYLNDANLRRDLFMINKVMHLNDVLRGVGVVKQEANAANTQLSEHIRLLESRGARTGPNQLFEIDGLTQQLNPQDEGLFEETFMEYRIALGLQPIQGLQPSPPASPRKHGFLWKKSRSPMKPWARRYFWIERGHLVTHQKDFVGLASVIGLSHCTIALLENDERPFVFQISSGENVVVIQAENEKEMSEWIRAMNEAMNGDDQPSLPHVITLESLHDAVFSEEPESEASSLSRDTQSTNLGPAAAMIRSQSGDADRSGANRGMATGLDGVAVLRAGNLALKEIRPRRPSLDNKDYVNVIWRAARFVLQQDGRLLQWNDANTKENLEILDIRKCPSLTRHHVHPVDESLFQRKNVFCVRLVEAGRNLFFAANSGMERSQWVHSLKQLTGGVLTGADGKPYRIFRNLLIRIVEGRAFNANADPYCEIYFGKDRMARTNTKGRGQSEPFWREDFIFDDCSAPKQGIIIYVMTQNKISKDSELGRVVIPAQNLKPGDVEAWYPVVTGDGGFIANMSSGSGSGGSSGHNGDLKLKIKYEEDIVLDKVEYHEILKVFAKIEQPLVYDIATLSHDLEYVSSLLLNIYDAQGLAIPWLFYLIDEEIEKTETMHVLFRGNSILTKAVDAYMKICGMDYLETTLGDILREICDSKLNCEVDPTRLEKNDDLKANWRRLYSTCEHIWNLIERSRFQIPREMRLIFHRIQKAVMQRFQKDEDKYNSVRYTSVSGFLFLRFFCPAVLNPKLFGLYKSFPDPKTSRSLTLIAKTLQCLANLANFGVKEPYMVDMNAFIMEHSNHLMEFIDNVSTVPSNTTPLSDHCIDLERQMCSMHRFVRENFKKFKSLMIYYRQRLEDLEGKGAATPATGVRSSSLNRPSSSSSSPKAVQPNRPSGETSQLRNVVDFAHSGDMYESDDTVKSASDPVSPLSPTQPPKKNPLLNAKDNMNSSMPNLLNNVEKPKNAEGVLTAGVAKMKLGTPVIIAASNSSLNPTAPGSQNSSVQRMAASQSLQALAAPASSSQPVSSASSSAASSPSLSDVSALQGAFNAKAINEPARVRLLAESLSRLLKASDAVHHRLLSKFTKK